MDIKFQGTMGIFQDTHNPFQDQRVIREVELFLFELQPDLMVYPGDMSDFYLLSKFDKNPNRADTLQQDLNSTAALFKRHREGMPNTRMIFTLGNHEDRLRRYLWSNSPALASLDCLTIEGLYKLRENEIECVDYEEGILFNGNFMVTHGDLIRAHSGYTAKGMSDKHGGSGICGHSHRGGNSLKTNRFGVYGWWENYCLCDLDLDYVSHPNWQQGFSVVTDIHERFWIEPIQIIHRKFIYGGKTYGSGGKKRVEV